MKDRTSRGRAQGPKRAAVTATVTVKPSQTGLEMAAGRRAVARHCPKHAPRRPAEATFVLGVLITQQLPPDPNLKLPGDIRATIRRGDAAFKKQSQKRAKSGRPKVITSVVDDSIQDIREANLEARIKVPTRHRRQPPMLARLRVVMIVVDRLTAEGVPFGTGPRSRMNKKVRDWLNERARRSPDTRKSRRKEITPAAVRALLRQVGAQGNAVTSRKSKRLTTQDAARERLRELQGAHDGKMD